MSSAAAGNEFARSDVHRLSIVVPVYQGERTLTPLLAEIETLTTPGETPRGRRFQVTEVILVHDGAIDHSHVVMESLAVRLPFVSLVWLSRNFGQHPATLAGMAATSGDWTPRAISSGAWTACAGPTTRPRSSRCSPPSRASRSPESSGPSRGSRSGRRASSACPTR